MKAGQLRRYRLSRFWHLFPLLLLAGTAWADCHPPDLDHPPGDPDAIRAAQAQEERCRKNPDYQFALGQALNLRQRYPEAAERLELALMLRPEHWPSRLEFLIALRGMGDHLAAQSLLADLHADPGLPPMLRAKLPTQLDSAPRSEQTMMAYRRSLTLTLGHDDNLLASPVVRDLELTLPGGRLPVTLSDDTRPRQGYFWRLDAHSQTWISGPSPDRLWIGSLTGSVRGTPGNSTARYAALETRLENAAMHQGSYYQLNLLAAFNQEGSFYRQSGGELGWDIAMSGDNCRLRLGAELQQRRYPHTTLLDGRYQGALLRYQCNGWRAETRLGSDLARSTGRAGGDQQRQNLLLGRVMQQGPHQWRLDYEYEKIRDRQGYSPLLENDRTRRTGKSLYRLEYLHRLNDLDLFTGAEITRQHASLPLFVTRSNLFYLGLRRTW